MRARSIFALALAALSACAFAQIQGSKTPTRINGPGGSTVTVETGDVRATPQAGGATYITSGGLYTPTTVDFSTTVSPTVSGSGHGSLAFDGTNITWSANGAAYSIFGGSTYTNLFQIDANVLAQRNGTNAQKEIWHNTYTDGSNGEWFAIDWQTTANSVRIGPAANGTGVLRNMLFTSNTIFADDNTYDIGASGANRPRNGYFSNNLSTATLNIGTVQLYSPSDNNVGINTGGACLFYFGSTTSSFPALKRNAAGLEARFADDSGYTTVRASNFIGGGAAISGNFSATGTATTAFVVTIGTTMANNTYEVSMTPTSLVAAAVFYVSAKTTTTFTITYLAGLTGAVSFDWEVFP